MMQLALYQILTPILAIVMIFSAISKYRRKEILIKNFLVQIFFWGGVVVVCFFPKWILTTLESVTGFKSGISGLLFLCILLLGTIVFWLIGENEKRGREISELVRELALLEAKKENKEK